MGRNTTEQDEVANAPVVEETVDAVADSTDAILEARVQEIFSAQFGGEGNGPVDGTAKWDDIVREMAVEADNLENEYRTVLTKKEHNRTLLRAFAGMGKVPTEVPDFYYPPRKRRSKKDIEE